MKRRHVSIVLALSASTLLLAGLAGCARKALQSGPASASPPSAPAPTEVPPPLPPSPSVPTQGELAPVFFGFDSHALNEAARTVLDQNAKRLREQPSSGITIEGHCDERGTIEYNQALGERRAQAARDYLTSAGIASTRIQVVSFGKERPFDDGHDEAAWASNRRAHFVIR